MRGCDEPHVNVLRFRGAHSSDFAAPEERRDITRVSAGEVADLVENDRSSGFRTTAPVNAPRSARRPR